jgi:hypothetical protein
VGEVFFVTYINNIDYEIDGSDLIYAFRYVLQFIRDSQAKSWFLTGAKRSTHTTGRVSCLQIDNNNCAICTHDEPNSISFCYKVIIKITKNDIN